MSTSLSSKNGQLMIAANAQNNGYQQIEAPLPIDLAMSPDHISCLPWPEYGGLLHVTPGAHQ
jgi:hypothetical protein